MKIKHQISLALFILFLLILGLGGVGSYYIHVLSVNSGEIIKDNYRTLQYINEMDNALDKIQYSILASKPVDSISSDALQKLKNSLHLQQANITESGEREITNELLSNTHLLFLSVKNEEKSESIGLINTLKQDLNLLYSLNEDALMSRNSEVQATAEKVLLYMIIIGSGTIVLALVVLFTFPPLIIRPIHEFNESINKVSGGNYDTKISLSRKDEFGKMAYSFNKMVGKLKEYEESSYSKILIEKNRLDAVINQIGEAIIGLDVSNRLLFVNKRALKLLHLKKEDLIGKYAPDVAVQNELLNALIQDLMIPDQEKKYKPISITEDRKEKLFAKDIVEITETPIGEDRAFLSGHVILLTDVTEFSEKEKAKTHFIATLSHELKTPVAAIHMSTSLMRNVKSGQLTEKQDDLLSAIERNNERIRHMINEILDMSKIESGTIDVSISEENVKDLINNAADGVRPFLTEKHLKITMNIADNLPSIRVDAHKTVWILNNFLTNAIRYAPPGSSIHIDALIDNSYLKIRVTDHGHGISSENQNKIFQKFTRLKSESSGTGLGLAISKEFVEAMGGTIGVYSKEGEGASFWIGFNLGS